MIEHLGIEWVMRITGAIALLANILAGVFVCDRNSIIRPKQQPFDLTLVWRAEVLLLLSWALFSILGYIALLLALRFPDIHGAV